MAAFGRRIELRKKFKTRGATFRGNDRIIAMRLTVAVPAPRVLFPKKIAVVDERRPTER
jgi:hypothetical protein